MLKKSIIVLANSYKPGGRCVAGKEVIQHDDGTWALTDSWIRPVTSNSATHGSITSRHHCIDNRDIKLMDIITVDLLHHSPDLGQPENWLIDESKSWVLEDQFNSTICAKLTDAPADLWLDNSQGVKLHEVGSSYEKAGRITNSLYLIKPENFKVHLSNDFNPWNGANKKESKVSFSYNGVKYSGISMTDTVLRSLLEPQYPAADGVHVIADLPKGDNYHICVSLSPIFDKTGKHYKLAAAVI